MQNPSQTRISGPEKQTRITDLGKNTRFKTPPADGQFRDEIVVECQTLNERPFKGSITYEEARETIFHDVLGFEHYDLYSIRMRYSGCPMIKFKLKEQTNVDDLARVEYFNLERKALNSGRVDYIGSRVMGIRGMTSVPHYDGSENDVRWVKLEGCDYQLTEAEIKEGLAPFGELLSPIREDIYEDSDSERDPVGNGTYSVKMKSSKAFPQLLLMHGKRVRIYHSGITKLCTNCFGEHTRRQCRNKKVQWIVYIREIMVKHKDLGPDYYGRWWDIVDAEFPGYFDEPTDQDMQQDSQDRLPELEMKSTDTRPTKFAEKRDRMCQSFLETPD